MAWKCDSALPDGGHGVGTMVDDDTNVAEFSLEYGKKAHGFAPLGGTQAGMDRRVKVNKLATSSGIMAI